MHVYGMPRLPERPPPKRGRSAEHGRSVRTPNEHPECAPREYYPCVPW